MMLGAWWRTRRLQTDNASGGSLGGLLGCWVERAPSSRRIWEDVGERDGDSESLCRDHCTRGAAHLKCKQSWAGEIPASEASVYIHVVLIRWWSPQWNKRTEKSHGEVTPRSIEEADQGSNWKMWRRVVYSTCYNIGAGILLKRSWPQQNNRPKSVW